MNVAVENIDTKKDLMNKSKVDVTPFERKSVWKERLILFIKAEYSFRKLQYIYALSNTVLFFCIGFLIFTLNRPQIIAAWLFIVTIIMFFGSIFSLFIIVPLVNASKKHRNELSQRFYQHQLYVEFTKQQVLLISRANGLVICRIKFHK